MASPAVMFVAGDPSGDQNTAPVIHQLRKEIPACECYGIGGPAMQAEGFTAFLPFGEFNRMGYVEVLTHLPFFLSAKKLLIREMKARRPGCVVCVDYSGFNTQIMKAAHGLGIPVLWYIAPKVWAWKKKKHTTNLKKYVTHIAVIFPFEVAILLPYVKDVTFVGNPLVEYIESRQYTIATVNTVDLRNKEAIRLAVVPGSRLQEIITILPVMIETCQQLREHYPHMSITVSRCSHIPQQTYTKLCGTAVKDFFDGPLEDLFAQSDLALVTSGTATLQTALMGVPMIIMYRTSRITYYLFKTFIKGINHIGLPNIIAQEEIVPECIQDAMTPQNVSGLLQRYIDSPEVYQSVVKKLVSLKQELGNKKPSIEVCRIIKQLCGINEGNA